MNSQPKQPNSHDQLQAECFQWHWGTYPNERGLLHSNNNNSENRIKGNQNKAVGIVKGVADLEYFKNQKLYFIEIKWDSDTQSRAQINFQKLVESQGAIYVIIRSFEEFQALINQIQNNEY